MSGMMEGMEDGHPTFEGPDEDEHSPEEAEALERFLKPINPDPLTVFTKDHKEWLSRMLKQTAPRG